MPELIQFDSGKSIILKVPPKNVAGLARVSVNSKSLEPLPPAKINAYVSLVKLLMCLSVWLLTSNPFSLAARWLHVRGDVSGNEFLSLKKPDYWVATTEFSLPYSLGT